MKKIGLFSVICAITALTACTNYSYIFDKESGNVISPLGYPGGNQGDLMDGFPLAFALVPPILEESGAPDNHSDYAIIVNNANRLKTVYTLNGSAVDWPEMDFQSNSLVVGRIWCNDVKRIANQRVEKKLGRVVLYLDVQEGAGIHSPTFVYFAALYPKLPDLPVKINRWNNY